MKTRRSHRTDDVTQCRLAEGRGKGTGVDYKPWLRVEDTPVKTRTLRAKGNITGRVHHMIGELAVRVFYILDWSPEVRDFREQYPLLPLEETLAIAEECGIAHPTVMRARRPVVMTTDLLVTRQCEGEISYEARALRFASELEDPRVIEKLEIERRYWKRRDIDWGIITEREIHQPLVNNLRVFRSRCEISCLYPLSKQLIYRVAHKLTGMVKNEISPLSTIALRCDDECGLPKGSSLAIAWHLMATRQWRVDLNVTINPCERLILLGTKLSSPLGM